MSQRLGASSDTIDPVAVLIRPAMIKKVLRCFAENSGGRTAIALLSMSCVPGTKAGYSKACLLLIFGEAQIVHSLN